MKSEVSPVKSWSSCSPGLVLVFLSRSIPVISSVGRLIHRLAGRLKVMPCREGLMPWCTVALQPAILGPEGRVILLKNSLGR